MDERDGIYYIVDDLPFDGRVYADGVDISRTASELLDEWLEGMAPVRPMFREEPSRIETGFVSWTLPALEAGSDPIDFAFALVRHKYPEGDIAVLPRLFEPGYRYEVWLPS